MKNQNPNQNQNLQRNLKHQEGEERKVAGRLRWNPLVYARRDGSKTYLFRVDSPISGGKRAEHTYLLAHVDAQEVTGNPFSRLHEGQWVSVRYVFCRDDYLDTEGEPNICDYRKVVELQV